MIIHRFKFFRFSIAVRRRRESSIAFTQTNKRLNLSEIHL